MYTAERPRPRCSVPGCPDDARTRGLCPRHYKRFQRGQSLTDQPRAGVTACATAGCPDPRYRRSRRCSRCLYYHQQHGQFPDATQPRPYRFRGGPMPPPAVTRPTPHTPEVLLDPPDRWLRDELIAALREMTR